MQPSSTTIIAHSQMAATACLRLEKTADGDWSEDCKAPTGPQAVSIQACSFF